MADRYATVQQLQTAVEEFQGGLVTGGAAKAPRLLYAIIAVLALAVVVLVVLRFL
jgi:hypothetical protein